MKKQYEAPKADKLEFNYTQVVTSSDTPGRGDKGKGWGCTHQGDNGKGRGCRKR